MTKVEVQELRDAGCVVYELSDGYAHTYHLEPEAYFRELLIYNGQKAENFEQPKGNVAIRADDCLMWYAIKQK